MKNLIKVIPILLLFIFIGCNDLSETVYSTLTVDNYTYKSDEVYNVIGAVYQAMIKGYGDYYHDLQEMTTDEMVLPANSTGWDNGGTIRVMHQHTWTSESGFLSSTWNWLYQGVIKSNLVIELIESGKLPVPSGENKESLIAEMKVARAFYYWHLIDNFGDVPFITSATSDLPSRTARATVYEAIVADIKNALDNNLLKSENSPEMYGRLNKWGAKALLANLYLNARVYTGTAAWDKCLAECNDIIGSGKYQLEENYTDCFSAHNEKSKETIFALANDENYTPWSFIVLFYSLHSASYAKYSLQESGWGAGGLKAVPQFIDTYDSEDKRIDATWEHGPQFKLDGVTPIMCAYERAGNQLDYTKDMANGIYTSEDAGYRVIKFKPQVGGHAYLSNDIPVLRYGQVLMMKAECLLRTGQANAAAAIVTEVRQRDFKAHPEKTTVSGAQLTADSKYPWGYYATDYALTKGTLEKSAADITPVEFGGFYDELGYEFAYEWMRRRDMIRFGTFTTKSWLSHKPNGEYRTVFPIPQAAIDANPNLKQTTGY